LECGASEDFSGVNKMGKIAEKAVCRSVFLTNWHCNLSALLRTVFWRFCPLGNGFSCLYQGLFNRLRMESL